MNEFWQIPLFEISQDAVPIMDIQGFSYQENFITSQLEQSLIEYIDQKPWDIAWKRRLQQYGKSYNKNRQAQSIPSCFMQLCERLTVEKLFPETPNQILINEYPPGIGIAPHCDYPGSGKIIAGLSLGASTMMDFIGPGKQKLSQFLERRSLYIISGISRNDWKHGIAPRKTDKYQGVTMERKRRISCTFRIALTDKGNSR